MESSNFESLCLDDGPGVSIPSSVTGLEAPASSGGMHAIVLENIMSSGDRNLVEPFNNTDGPGSYSNIDYSGSVVQVDHSAKFSDSFISAESDFVDVNVEKLKGSNSSTCIDLYLDTLPTNCSSTSQHSNVLSRPEHQTPKAQILGRHYSGYNILQNQNVDNHISISEAKDDNSLSSIKGDLASKFSTAMSNSVVRNKCSNITTAVTDFTVSSDEKAFLPSVYKLTIQETSPFSSHTDDLKLDSNEMKSFSSLQSPYPVFINSKNSLLMDKVSNNVSFMSSNTKSVTVTSDPHSQLISRNEVSSQFDDRLGYKIDDFKLRLNLADNAIGPEELEEDSNGDYTDSSISSDGRKLLPHKKRIPKKLKNNKKSNKFIKCNDQLDTQVCFSSLKQSLPLKVYACEICFKECDSQLNFFEHLKVHYEPFEKHKCENCGGLFLTLESLEEHSQVHARRLFQCNICQKTFKKEIMLEFHINVTHNVEHVIGNDIQKPKLRSYNESQHNSQVVQNISPEYACEYCCALFRSKAKLQCHLKLNHKENLIAAAAKKTKISKSAKGFICPHCPRTFIHKNSLLYHIRVHTGVRPHECNKCGKAFFAASALRVHYRLHSGEKPYKCNQCDKYFRQWGDLRYHTTSVHSDERQFQCEYCGKDFKRKYCLVVHRRIHTGEKNYKCELCGKAFRAASYLLNHKRIHTGEKPHSCPDCGKTFRVKSDMKRHRQTHSKDNTGENYSIENAPCISPSNSSANDNHPHQQQIQFIPAGTIFQALETQFVLPERIGINEKNSKMIALPYTQKESSNPPPAHQQPMTCIAVSNSGSSVVEQHLSSTEAGGGGAAVSPELILVEDSSQPMNLNIIPRFVNNTHVSDTVNRNHQNSITNSTNDSLIRNGIWYGSSSNI